MALTDSTKLVIFMVLGSVMETLAVSLPVLITIAAMKDNTKAVALRMLVVVWMSGLEMDEEVDDLKLDVPLGCVPSKVLVVVLGLLLLDPFELGFNCCSM